MFIYQPRRVTRWCSRQIDQIRKVAVLRQTSKSSFGPPNDSAWHTPIYFSLKGTSKIIQPTSSAVNRGTSVSGHLWWSEFKFCLLLSFHYAKSSCHPKFLFWWLHTTYFCNGCCQKFTPTMSKSFSIYTSPVVSLRQCYGRGRCPLAVSTCQPISFRSEQLHPIRHCRCHRRCHLLSPPPITGNSCQNLGGREFIDPPRPYAVASERRGGPEW